jgi:hypothetical protein
VQFAARKNVKFSLKIADTYKESIVAVQNRIKLTILNGQLLDLSVHSENEKSGLIFFSVIIHPPLVKGGWGGFHERS